MKALILVVRSAVGYYASHNQVCAEPGVLYDVCEALARACNPQTPEHCAEVGLMAAKECAMPTREIVMELLNPEDLK